MSIEKKLDEINLSLILLDITLMEVAQSISHPTEMYGTSTKFHSNMNDIRDKFGSKIRNEINNRIKNEIRRHNNELDCKD